MSNPLNRLLTFEFSEKDNLHNQSNSFFKKKSKQYFC